MNMSNEMLEILMGKQIDSEITPAEKRLLDKHLAADEQSRLLMEELASINDIASAAVNIELSKIRSAEEIFEDAWDKAEVKSRFRTGFLRKNLKFAYGLAAGLMIGIMLQLNAQVINNDESVPTPTYAGNPDAAMPGSAIPVEDVRYERPERNVDYYMFTDTDGRRWMMEAYSQDNNIQPAMYYKGF